MTLGIFWKHATGHGGVASVLSLPSKALPSTANNYNICINANYKLRDYLLWNWQLQRIRSVETERELHTKSHPTIHSWIHLSSSLIIYHHWQPMKERIQAMIRSCIIKKKLSVNETLVFASSKYTTIGGRTGERANSSIVAAHRTSEKKKRWEKKGSKREDKQRESV